MDTPLQDIIDFTAFDLFIFDLDGTLSEYKTQNLLPGVAEYFAQHDNRIKLAIASNQGGVGLRYWMEQKDFGNPNTLPNAAAVEGQIINICQQLNHEFAVYTSYAYQSQKGVWSPTPYEQRLNPRWQQSWRKPQGGMLRAAMFEAQITPIRTMMIGDWDEDRQAAQDAGCYFVYAHQFFNRPKPEDEK